jgi:hypothetical protein
MKSQAPKGIMMVRPAAFGSNPETAGSNIFQAQADLSPEQIQQQAVAEFDQIAAKLTALNVPLLIVEDSAEPIKTDAIFPNNWISTHQDGTVVLYPMLSKVRRFERRPEVLNQIEVAGHPIKKLLDFCSYENEAIYLEGTGSIVFDYLNGKAYVCGSSRSNFELTAKVCKELGYELLFFSASSPSGAEIYHTNVILSIGTGYAIIASSLIEESDRHRILAALNSSGRVVIEIDFDEVCAFAGNCMEVQDKNGSCFLVMSESVKRAISREKLEQIGSILPIHFFSLPTIEKYGGGSIRCMLCGLYN